MNDTPTSLITPAEVNAAQLHELKVTYVEAGFTEDEAMQLIINIINTSVATQIQLQARGFA